MTTLLDAGIAALAEKGYHASRVDDVVRIARVSHGTFYLYFSNKEDLFRALAERCADEMEALAAQLDGVSGGPEGQEVLRDWLADFLTLYRAHGAVVRAWAEQQVADRSLAELGRASFGHISESLRDALPTGGGGRVTELRAAALLGLIERFAYVVTSRDLGRTDDQILDTLAGVIHRGWFRRAG